VEGKADFFMGFAEGGGLGRFVGGGGFASWKRNLAGDWIYPHGSVLRQRIFSPQFSFPFSRPPLEKPTTEITNEYKKY
jgi:hypothetical protein